jgi:hypothetical protein
LCVKLCRVGGGIFFQSASLAIIEPPNKACSGFLGVCGFEKHFSGFELFLLPNIFSPAQNPLTQTVGQKLSLNLLRCFKIILLQKLAFESSKSSFGFLAKFQVRKSQHF